MANIFVLSYDGSLGAELSARLVVSSQHHVFLCMEETGFFSREELISLVQRNLSRQAAGRDLSSSVLNDYFTLVSYRCEGNAASVVEDLPAMEEVWLLEGEDSSDILSTRTASDRAADALSLLRLLRGRVFNYVDSMYARHEIAIVQEEIARECKLQGIPYRMFHAAAMIDQSYIRGGSGGNDIRQLMASLDDITAEVQERLGEYFDYQSLRVLAKPDAAVNLVRLEDAAEIMVRVSQEKSTLGGEYYIAAPHATPLKALAKLLGKLYSANLTLVQDRQQLNVIDRLLEQRFSALADVFTAPMPAWAQDGSHAAGIPVESLLPDAATQQKIFSAVRQKQKADRKDRNQRAASVGAKLSARTIDKPGASLKYFVGGTEGPYLLVLNALGQGIEFWKRLLDHLMRDHRVVIWETRGLEAESEPLKLEDHVDDIESILREEQIESCYLLGWCTGPQIAVEFYLRCPEAVNGLAFLSSVFKFTGRNDLETSYSLNLIKLCRLLNAHPEMAPSVMRSLSTSPPSDINLLDNTDSNTTAVQVLSLTNIDLRNDVLAPFRTERTTLNYARQLNSLLECPTQEKMGQVKAPVLIIGCEYDQVALAKKSREAAQLFSNCRHIELQGATHYSFYDRTEVVGAMLRRFFQSPTSITQTERQLAASVA